MTLDQLVGIRTILEKFATSRCKVTTAYKIAKLFANTDADYQFYKEKLADLIDDYGAVDEDGKSLSNESGLIIKDDKMDEFNDKFNTLIQTEINSIIPKFKVEEFDEMETTPTQMYTLLPIIEE